MDPTKDWKYRFRQKLGESNFSHIETVWQQLAHKHESCNLFLIEDAPVSGVPVFIAVAIEKGDVSNKNTPCSFALHNKTNEVVCLERLGYEWKRLDRGQYCLLHCTDDPKRPQEGPWENYLREEFSLYVASPMEMKRLGKKLIVTDVTYSIKDENSEIHKVRFQRKDEHPKEHIKYVVQKFFNGDAGRQAYVFAQLQNAMEAQRAEREERIKKYFEDKTFDAKDKNMIFVYKILPLNFPSKVTNTLSNRFFNGFNVQVVQFADSLVGQHSLVGLQNEKFVENRKNFKLCMTIGMILLVDFLKRVNQLDYLNPENRHRILEVYSHDRISQILGCAVENMQDVKRNELIDELLQSSFGQFDTAISEKEERTSATFIMNVLYPGEKYTGDVTSSNRTQGASANKLRLHYRKGNHLEIHLHGDKKDKYYPIKGENLLSYISEEALPQLIITLLKHEGQPVTIPAGSRVRATQHQVPDDVNCMKEAFLSLPDDLLSLEGKARARAELPDCEFPEEVFIDVVQTKVKSVGIRKIKDNVHHYAMTSKKRMLGFFGSGTRRHCVSIDGIADVITDSSGKYCCAKRSADGLKKLEISKFEAVWEVFRQPEIPMKARKRYEKKLGLPFLKGSIDKELVGTN